MKEPVDAVIRGELWNAPSPTTISAARNLATEVMICAVAKEPMLTREGLGHYKGRPEVWPRLDPYKDVDIIDMITSLAYVSTMSPIKSISRKLNSYGMKHDAESRFGRLRFSDGVVGNHYTGNAHLIAAMVAAGYRYTPVHPRSVNVFFNASAKNIRTIW